VRVSRGNEFVGGTSIMGLMMLAAGPGTEITVVASGKERAEVLAALETLVNERFGEDD
jgi:phosphocarrier protein